jgi:hypothetical protein
MVRGHARGGVLGPSNVSSGLGALKGRRSRDLRELAADLYWVPPCWPGLAGLVTISTLFYFVLGCLSLQLPLTCCLQVWSKNNRILDTTGLLKSVYEYEFITGARSG